MGPHLQAAQTHMLRMRTWESSFYQE